MDLKSQLSQILAAAFEKAGYSSEYGKVVESKLPGVDFQCNSALTLAKLTGTDPKEIAKQIVDILESNK